MNDDELHQLIRGSQPKVEVPTSFTRDVWARIAVAEQQSWAAQWRQFAQSALLWVAKPAPAFAVVSTMLVIGAGLGNLTAPVPSTAALRSSYQASINPFGAAHKGTAK